MRSFCTGLLALLAWLPVGHAQSRVLRGNPREPALAAASALDVAANSPSRIGGAETFGVRTLPPRRPATTHSGDGSHVADVVVLRGVNALSPVAAPAMRRWAPRVRATRLTIPYDATAPPGHQS